MLSLRIQGSAIRRFARRSYSTPQTTSKCPEPTCQCAATPPDLDIDRKLPLNGSMAPYAQHVVVYTGKDDWASRIEDDDTPDSPWGFLIRQLKTYLGRGGQYADPYNNVVITSSSFKPKSIPTQDQVPSRSNQWASAFIFPRGIEVPKIAMDAEAVEGFIRAYLQPDKLHSAHNILGDSEKSRMTRQASLETQFAEAFALQASPTVLICSHGGRDNRCGVMGPLLKSEFERVFSHTASSIAFNSAISEVARTESRSHVVSDASTNLEGARLDEENDGREDSTGWPWARVGLISHIGGHKFAGNVILYVPASFEIPGKGISPLAGYGIWYGRVEPKHVEGIVQATLLEGKIIEELFRGGVNSKGEMLRL